jgi:hypothetical protein
VSCLLAEWREAVDYCVHHDVPSVGSVVIIETLPHTGTYGGRLSGQLGTCKALTNRVDHERYFVGLARRIDFF